MYNLIWVLFAFSVASGVLDKEGAVYVIKTDTLLTRLERCFCSHQLKPVRMWHL